MSRAARHALNGLTVLSLLPCVATAAAWAWSYWRCDGFTVDTGDSGRMWILAAPRGRLEVVRLADRSKRRYPVWRHDYGEAKDADWPRETFLGFGYYESRIGRYDDERAVIVPHAFLVGLFGLLPVVRGYGRFGRRRALIAGHCVSCGYDLRATADR